MDANDPVTRRALLATVASVGGASVAGCLGGDSREVYEGEEFVADDPDYGGWLAAAGHEGTVDWTDEDEVTVLVGTGREGMYFGPAAARIDRETSVVWEWTGDGGRHNVVANDGEFASDQYAKEGATFERSFDELGTYRYVCEPHERRGMKGVVDVV